MLAYKPNKFFDELERKTGASRATLSSTMSRAKHSNYIADKNGSIALTWRGKVRAEYQPTKKVFDGMTIVIFDIPEVRRKDRYQLRCYLRMMKFEPIQKSVWASEYEPGQELTEVVTDLKLETHVQVLKAQKL